MRRRLFSLVSLVMVLALLSALAPTQVRPLEAQAQSDIPTTPVVSQGNPITDVELSVPQAPAAAEAASAASAESSRGMELVGQFGGDTYAVAIQGSYAYIGVGQRLTILNISNPASPVAVGRTPLLGGVVGDVAVAGNYAYVAAGMLRVIDISAPSNPYEVSFYDTPGGVNGVTLTSGYAYVADGYGGLRVLNVSIPESPYEVGFCDTPGLATDVAVSGGYAYVTDATSGLRIVNVSTPSNPYEVGFYDTPGYAHGVAVDGSHAYVADGEAGLRAVNISTPSNPHEVGFYDTPGNAWDVAVAGIYAYVADSGSSFRVVNVSVPSSPYEVGYFSDPMGGFASSVAISGSYAFVAYESRGLQVLNISSPSSPYQVGSYETSAGATGVTVIGSYAYIADLYAGLKIIDVTDPSEPTLVGACELPSFALKVAVAGSYAYVAGAWVGGLQVLNVANPSNPYVVASYRIDDGSALDVAVAGSYAYVGFGSAGLRVIDISTPSNPREVGFYDTPGEAYGVALVGDYAYVADDTAGLRVVNISTPSNPYQVGFYDTPGNARGVAVAGPYAYVTDLGSGLRVVDISVPSNPHEVAFFDAGDSVHGVTVAGDFAYLAAGWSGGLRVVNVSMPNYPVEVGFYDTLSTARGVTVAGGLAYVADWNAGLSILRRQSAWTLMFFMPADNNVDEQVSFEHLGLQHGAQNPDINVVSFYDNLTSEAMYAAFMPEGVVGPDGQGELNTGEPSTLSNFMQWAKTNFPAERYALIVSDHGHALGGTAYDTHPSTDHLTPSELQEALQAGGWVDVLYMANCLMANMEVEYQLRGLAEYYVASESISWLPRSHISYIMPIDETTTPYELARSMAQSYSNQFSEQEGYPSTISAVRLADVEGVAAAASALASAVREHWLTVSISVWGLTDAAMLQRFDENFDLEIDNDDRLADLYHFAQLAAGLPESDLQTAANALMAALDSYVVYNDAWSGPLEHDGETGFWDHGNANGVSIAIPRSQLSFYTFDWLDFADGADWTPVGDIGVSTTEDGLQWGPLLVDLVNEFNPDGPDTPDPPEPLPPLVVIWNTYLPLIFRSF